MPLLSSDVAFQVAQGQQDYFSRVQQADYITEALRRTHDPQYGAPQLAGRALNTLTGIGAPIGGLAMGMLGLDAMSLGHRAFGLSRAAGMGYMGAGGMALGAFGLGTAGMMGASWVANQAQQGAQQQQQFMMGMQKSFNFMTPFGQQGFSNQQLGVMGGGLRGMSGQIGPQGQMVGFEELSSLAQNSGRMGMMQGSQDVTSFFSSFRKQLETFKTIAREVGTSLQEAQQMVHSMRNTGVFNSNAQVKLATDIRNFATTGGMTAGMLMEAAGQGSMISRAIGGRGSAGAFAGVRTLGMVGQAVQAGVLSDEDIYNATGMRGAEGQQAYASAQMQHSAAWLRRGGRSRYFLASIAGANGELDPGSVAAWQNGDMSVGATSTNAYRNLGRVGRADFIRNEGRLRGEALAAFGGNLPAMALQQWASSRGVDINNMDDRSMLFAQRQLGMDREMVDSAVKMLQGMPEMSRQSRWTARSDAMRTDAANHKRTSGVEGVRRKIEEAREHAQNAIQGAGQQVYTDIVNNIDSMLQETSGHITNQVTKEVDRAYEALTKGQSGKLTNAVFGLDKGSYVPSAQKSMGGAGGGMSFGQFQRGSLFGVSMQDKMDKAGYATTFSGVSDDKTLSAALTSARDFAEGAQLRGSAEVGKLGADNAGLLRRIYEKEGLASVSGADRMMRLRKALRAEKGSDAAKDLMAALDPETGMRGAAANLATLEGAFLDDRDNISAKSALPAGASLVGGGEGDGTRLRRYGGGGKGYLGAALSEVTGYRQGAGFIKNASNMMQNLGLNLMTAGAYSGIAALTGIYDATKANRAADAEGQRRITAQGLMETTDILKGVDRQDTIRERMRGLAEGSDELKTQKDLLTLNRMTMSEKAGGKVDWNAGGGKYAKLRDQLEVSADEQQDINRRAAAAMGKVDASRMLRSLNQAGVVDAEGNITSSAAAKLGVTHRGDALQRQLAILRTQRQGGSKVDDFKDILEQGGYAQDALMGMSVGDLRDRAKKLREMGAYDAASSFSGMAAEKGRIDRALARGGDSLGTATALGLQLSREEKRELYGTKAGSGRLAGFLAHKLGVQGLSAEEQATLEASGKDLDAQLAGGKISKTDYADRKREIDRKLSSGKTDEELMKKLAALDEKGISREERNKRIMNLENDAGYQQKKKEQQREEENKNPMVRHLDKISGNMEKMVTAMGTLPSNIASAINNTSGPPGNGKGDGTSLCLSSVVEAEREEEGREEGVETRPSRRRRSTPPPLRPSL